MSRHFKIVFLTRFLGYLVLQIGLLAIILTVEPVVTEELKYRADQFLGHRYSLPQVITSASTSLEPTPAPSGEPNTSFGNLSSGNTEIITPVSTDFGLVIEKINANAKIIPNVDASNEKEYLEALSKGIAHAKGTHFPGDKGNIYLFSHSTDAPWNFVRYNAIFYLLNKLETGDRVILFYQGRRYDYIVFDKVVVSPTETSYLTNHYDEEILTLQTCDPPGTTFKRLVVRAKRAGI